MEVIPKNNFSNVFIFFVNLTIKEKKEIEKPTEEEEDEEDKGKEKKRELIYCGEYLARMNKLGVE